MAQTIGEGNQASRRHCAPRRCAGQAGHGSPEVTLQFVAGAFTALLAWWLNGKARLAPEALDAMFQQLVGNGLARHPRSYLLRV